MQQHTLQSPEPSRARRFGTRHDVFRFPGPTCRLPRPQRNGLPAAAASVLPVRTSTAACPPSELGRFLGVLPLREITIGHVIGCQNMRQEQVRRSRRHRARLAYGSANHESDGGSRINHELAAWPGAGARRPVDGHQALLPAAAAAQVHLDGAESGRKEKTSPHRARAPALLCGLLLRPGDAQHHGHARRGAPPALACGHLDGPEGSVVYVDEGVKEPLPQAPLPLSTHARWAIGELLERARGMGAAAPEHYLLPHRAHTRGAAADPTRPMGSWKRAHYAMCKAAAVCFPRFRLSGRMITGTPPLPTCWRTPASVSPPSST